jgi:hypothetical protein
MSESRFFSAGSAVQVNDWTRRAERMSIYFEIEEVANGHQNASGKSAHWNPDGAPYLARAFFSAG